MGEMIIERDEDEDDNLISWWEYDEGLEPEAQVLVDADEVAVFFDEKALVQLGPGRHLITAESQPVLADYISDDEAQAIDVAFVRTRNYELFFDDRAGDVRDAETNVTYMLWVACETLELKVTDPAKVIDRVLQFENEGAFEEFVAGVAFKRARDLVGGKPPALRALLDDSVEMDATGLEAAINAELKNVDLGVTITLKAPLVCYVADEEREALQAKLG